MNAPKKFYDDWRTDRPVINNEKNILVGIYTNTFSCFQSVFIYQKLKLNHAVVNKSLAYKYIDRKQHCSTENDDADLDVSCGIMDIWVH